MVKKRVSQMKSSREDVGGGGFLNGNIVIGVIVLIVLLLVAGYYLGGYDEEGFGLTGNAIYDADGNKVSRNTPLTLFGLEKGYKFKGGKEYFTWTNELEEDIPVENVIGSMKIKSVGGTTGDERKLRWFNPSKPRYDKLNKRNEKRGRLLTHFRSGRKYVIRMNWRDRPQIMRYVSDNNADDVITVAEWNFNSFPIIDETGDGNNGHVVGDPEVIDGALQLDGDDAIRITKTSSIDLTENVILEARVKRKSSGDGMIISKNGPYFMAIRNNVIVGGIYSNDGNCESSCVTPGKNTWKESKGSSILNQDEWYNLKIIYDGSSINVYVNGFLEKLVPKTGAMPQVSQQVHIGWGEPGHNQYFNGLIDYIRISKY